MTDPWLTLVYTLSLGVRDYARAMKFAHEFKEALIQEGFPPHWVESAIPYGQLKKCIKKVERELRSIGLDSATLAQ